MNVRIFWVHAMECMCAQTRPRFINSSERVIGKGVRSHVNSKGKIPSFAEFPILFYDRKKPPKNKNKTNKKQQQNKQQNNNNKKHHHQQQKAKQNKTLCWRTFELLCRHWTQRLEIIYMTDNGRLWTVARWRKPLALWNFSCGWTNETKDWC